ncbi:MAG: ABC transporter permease [Thermoprotei archaeon]|nr:ABC transporter permease [Thermoprotei archaeon]
MLAMGESGLRKVYPVLESLAALIAGIIGGFIVSAVLGYDPFASISLILLSGFGNIEYLLSISVPLTLSALAFIVPLRAGLFNIGVEGQAYVGALAAVYVSSLTGFPLPIILAPLAGALIGFLIGVLRVYRGVNEVVSSIMLNWTLFYTVSFTISRYLRDPVIVHQSVRVDRMLSALEALLIALAITIAVHTILYRTTLGYYIRVMGSSPEALKYSGSSESRVTLTAMSLGGVLGGLAGALQVYTVSGFIDVTMSAVFGIGFMGIAAGLIGRATAVGALPASILISALIIGGHKLELVLGAPPELADVMIGVMMLALSAPYALRLLSSKVLG